MSGRMNWDKVRKNTISNARGSEYLNPFEDPNQIDKKKKKGGGSMKTCSRCQMRSPGMKEHFESCIYFVPKRRPRIVGGGFPFSNRRKF